jgi:hypothetical protein
MKKFFQLINLNLLILMIPFSVALGQSNKSEQKVKVIIDDGSGPKTVVDTLYKNTQMPDSIRLKDGTMIFLNQHGDNPEVRHHKGKEHIYVTVSDGKDDRNIVKEYTIVRSDSANKNMESHGKEVVVYDIHNSGERNGNEKYEVTTRVSKEPGDKGDIIYITKRKSPMKESDDTFDVYVDNDGKDSKSDKTRFVIAKDGMVVTIEGNDEAKAKDLAKEIENKLGVKSEGTDKPEPPKSESNKTTKK